MNRHISCDFSLTGVTDIVSQFRLQTFRVRAIPAPCTTMKLVSIPSPDIPAIRSESTAGSAGSPSLLLQSIPGTFSGEPSPSDSDMACRSCAHADRRLSSLMLSSSPLFVIAAPPALPAVPSQINQCHRGVQARVERRHVMANSAREYLA